jgi:hypothetical protein
LTRLSADRVHDKGFLVACHNYARTTSGR